MSFDKTFSLLLTLYIFISCNPVKENTVYNYPKAPGEKEVEEVFGMKINDDYRSLEDLKKQDVIAWYAMEDTLTENYFKSSQTYKELKDHFSELRSRSTSYVYDETITDKGSIFYLDWLEGQKDYNLYYKETLNSNPVHLFDPSQYKDGKYIIKYISPSHKGDMVAVALGRDSEFHSEIIIIDIKTKKQINNQIAATNAAPDFAGGIQWIPEKDLITYLYFPNADSNDKPEKEDSYTVLYDIKTGKSYKLFGKSEDLNVDQSVYPIVKIRSQKDSHIQGYIGHAGRYWKSYILPIESITKTDHHNWKQLYSEKDSIIYDYGILKESSYYFLKNFNGKTVLGKVNIDTPNFDTSKVIAESYSNNEIKHFRVLKDKILFSRVFNGVDASLFTIDSTGKEQKIKLPFQAGNIAFQSKSINQNDIWVQLSGWTRSPTYYNIDARTNQLREIDFASSVNYPEFRGVISEQISVSGHDGVQIPLTIIRKQNSKNTDRLIIEAYGAYGDMLEPFFSPIYLDWVAQGGVLAFAHVRGGGEKGPKWHEDGMKDKKINSWKDLISCAEYVIREGYTTPEKLALFTSSAGGITGGMAVNERPDLFSAFVSLSPRLNPVRTESSITSSSSYKEYGSIKDSTEAKYLIKMDPYLNINSALSYPSTLILSGFHDDRIPISDGGKYIAKIQSFGNKSKPYLLDINYDEGHGASNDVNDLYARIFGFIYENID